MAIPPAPTGRPTKRRVARITVVSALLIGSALLFLLMTSGVVAPEVKNTNSRSTTTVSSREPISPIPLTIDLDQRKVALGDKLFHDTRLSGDDSISCASCHSLTKGGDDGQPRSIGIRGAEGDVNAPTVFNSTFNFRQFWDGRAHTLEEQVDGPILAEKEMGSTWEQVIHKLRASDDYVTAFAAVYPGGIQPEHVRNAIAEFERSLITPNSRFDRWLRGEDKAITEDERRGYRAFKRYGCSSCHQGINVGGNMFETLGAVQQEYFPTSDAVRRADLGRFNVTGREEDRHVFKVPGLRNVELTAPYFHDGAVASLEEAVRTMATNQLGRPIPEADVDLIVLFLKTLTGVYTPRKS